MENNKILKEAWDGMVKEGLLDSLSGNQQSTQPVDKQIDTQVDPAMLKQVQDLKQQILEIDNKIAPLAAKKRKLEEQLYKLQK